MRGKKRINYGEDGKWSNSKNKKKAKESRTKVNMTKYTGGKKHGKW